MTDGVVTLTGLLNLQVCLWGIGGGESPHAVTFCRVEVEAKKQRKV